MKPVEQTIPGPPRGDCFRACIASLLELPITWLPNPHLVDGRHFWDDWQEWLGERGWTLVEWDVPSEGIYSTLRGYWIAAIPSRNITEPDAAGDPPRHCIVMRGDQIAHDPALGEKFTADNWRESDRILSVTLLVPLDPASADPYERRNG